MKNPVNEQDADLIREQLAGWEGEAIYEIQVHLARSQGGQHTKMGGSMIENRGIRVGAAPNSSWASERGLIRTGLRIARTRK